jgi:hypothetical protein
MVDLSTTYIRNLFNQQILELTRRTLHAEDSFDIQFSERWLP